MNWIKGRYQKLYISFVPGDNHCITESGQLREASLKGKMFDPFFIILSLRSYAGILFEVL